MNHKTITVFIHRLYYDENPKKGGLDLIIDFLLEHGYAVYLAEFPLNYAQSRKHTLKRVTKSETELLEAFTTPTYVIGRIVGDVIINVDRSYRLDKDNLFIVEAEKNGYKLISAPKIVGDAFRKRKRDAWKTILEQEKNKSLDKEIIELKKRNFNHVGEFAINTSPSARLCDYLIVNEKIANMIHVAFGSGFEVDAATEYHMDVVIDSPRQKLDIYGVDKKKNRHWIIKSGAFVL